jgi:hypothetical protein
MKFCVMMAAEGDAVVHVEAEFGKECDRQDMVGLQMIQPTATSAATVARPHRLGPILALSTVPERLFDATVHVVRVVLACVKLREKSRLRLAALARLRTNRAIPAPVATCFAEASARFAVELLDPRVGQRPVDDVQDAFVLADGPDVPTEVLTGLEVGSESAPGLRHHLGVRSLARSATEPPLRGVFAAPGAVLFDHERTLPNTRSSS